MTSLSVIFAGIVGRGGMIGHAGCPAAVWTTHPQAPIRAGIRKMAEHVIHLCTRLLQISFSGAKAHSRFWKPCGQSLKAFAVSAILSLLRTTLNVNASPQSGR